MKQIDPTKEYNNKEEKNIDPAQSITDKEEVISDNDEYDKKSNSNFNEEKTESSKKNTPREQLRINANFKPIETLSKEFALHQFFCINYTLCKIEGPKIEPFEWKDPKLVEKLEEKIKIYDEHAETWNSWIFNKCIFNIHPETMGMYAQFLKTDDYIWQLLSRQLLIYKTFSNIIDDKTIEDVISGKINFNESIN